MNKLTKKKLVACVAVKNGITQAEAEKVIDSALGFIKESFKRGEDVMLWEFGKFVTKKVPERTMIGLGATHSIGERMKVRFVMSLKLKEELTGIKQQNKKSAVALFRNTAAEDE